MVFYTCSLKYHSFEENSGDLSLNPEMGLVLLANTNM